MEKRFLALLLAALMVAAASPTTAFAAETRGLRPPCLNCNNGYLVFTNGPVETDRDEANCQHGGHGLDLWDISIQTIYVTCSNCNYKDEKLDVSQKLVYCPKWG